MAKYKPVGRYKLIYEKNGSIYGSHTGIPNENDVLLIERAVLEGLKEPVVPQGELEITKNGVYDVEHLATVIINVKGGDDPEPEPPTPGPDPEDGAEVVPGTNTIEFGGNTTVEVDPSRPNIRILAVSASCTVEDNTLILGGVKDDTAEL